LGPSGLTAGASGRVDHFSPRGRKVIGVLFSRLLSSHSHGAASQPLARDGTPLRAIHGSASAWMEARVVAGFSLILTIWPPGHPCRRVPNARHLRFNPRALRHRSRLLCSSRLAHRRPRRNIRARSSTPQSKQRKRSSARSSRSSTRSSSHSSNHSSNHSSKVSPRTAHPATAASSGRTAQAARGFAWAMTSGSHALAPLRPRIRPILAFSLITIMLPRARTPT
jgi:hypothetical protein